MLGKKSCYDQELRSLFCVSPLELRPAGKAEARATVTPWLWLRKVAEIAPWEQIS
jgi:hypothetical protein